MVASLGALALVLTVVACSSPAHPNVVASLAPHSQLPDATRQQLSAAVTDAMAATGSSGAIAGVWAPWSGTWVQGLGSTTWGGKTPVDPDMTFRAGPVTRAMTCDVLYEVADRGTVRLTDSVTKYVSGIPKLSEVTLQQLCDGTSGIGSYRGVLEPLLRMTPGRTWDPRELVGYGIGQVGEDLQPGVGFRDSDAGYVLLGLALERATGKSASALLSEYVFDPLGLSSSKLPGATASEPVVGSSQPLPGYYLASRTKSGAYVCDKQTDITEQSASFGFTDSGVVSDIEDVAAYAHALAEGTLVPTKKRLAAPLAVAPTAPAWFTTAGGVVKVGPLIGQYGQASGYLTAAFADPASDLVVAVVLNDSTAGQGPIIDLVRELAAIASMAPGVGGKAAPALGLPWTADQFHATIAKNAICPVPRS